jgi:hypothetical protein
MLLMMIMEQVYVKQTNATSWIFSLLTEVSVSKFIDIWNEMKWNEIFIEIYTEAVSA